jgi:hypothetical protein
VDSDSDAATVSATASTAETASASPSKPAVSPTPTAAPALSTDRSRMVEQQINYGVYFRRFGDSGSVHMRHLLVIVLFQSS